MDYIQQAERIHRTWSKSDPHFSQIKVKERQLTATFLYLVVLLSGLGIIPFELLKTVSERRDRVFGAGTLYTSTFPYRYSIYKNDQMKAFKGCSFALLPLFRWNIDFADKTGRTKATVYSLVGEYMIHSDLLKEKWNDDFFTSPGLGDPATMFNRCAENEVRKSLHSSSDLLPLIDEALDRGVFSTSVAELSPAVVIGQKSSSSNHRTKACPICEKIFTRLDKHDQAKCEEKQKKLQKVKAKKVQLKKPVIMGKN